MKKSLVIAALLFPAAQILAQKQADVLPFKKERPDSARGIFPKLQQQPFSYPDFKEYPMPFSSAVKKTSNFTAANPGAVFLYKTSNRSVYNMPLDNMAVLVPDMNAVEKMPAGRQQFAFKQIDKMPNPYHLQRSDTRRK